MSWLGLGADAGLPKSLWTISLLSFQIILASTVVAEGTVVVLLLPFLLDSKQILLAVMKVKNIGKPRKNSHSLDMLPVASVVGALLSLETAFSSSQPMLAVGHHPSTPCAVPLAGWSPVLAPQHEHHPESHVLHSWGWCGQMSSGWRKKIKYCIAKTTKFLGFF